MFVVVAVLAVVLIGVLYVATRDRMDDGAGASSALEAPAPRETPDPSDTAEISKSPEATTSPSPDTVVLGDSFSSGTSGGPAWPDLLAEAVGSGVQTYADEAASYLARGGAPTLADLETQAVDALSRRERRGVTTVLLAGGRYDAGKGSYDRVGDAATELVDRVRDDFPDATVVMLSNFASGDSEDDGRRLAGRLATAADEAGVAYVDVTAFLRESDVGPDGTNPTDQGQQRLATRIEAALSDADQLEPSR